jgi:(p)ppGpp synthase/HD superfamily hydrolase
MPFSLLVERAIELAAEWHDQTYRKSRWREVPFDAPEAANPLRIPVMAHVTTVALTVQRAGWDDETVAAAFLHDVLEDRNRFGDHMAEDSLTTMMGEEVTRRVRYLTEPQFDERGEPLPWRIRKETYLARLREAPVEALAISLADKLHNAWTMNQALQAGHDLFTPAPGRKPLSAGPADQLWFFRAVLEVASSGTDARLDALRQRLASEIERFAELGSGMADDG